MKKQLCLLVMCLPMISFVYAQDDSGKGIQWTTGLSFEQVKQKAKQENKYIFLDCYATWCGPCKEMDKSVYVNDSVGMLFNEKFISVKVQMDKTDKDNEDVKSWYPAAATIGDEYVLQGYPSFVFFSPNGKASLVDAGFKKPKEIIDIAKKALDPGRAYENPKEKYLRLVQEYESGKKDYSQYPYMIQMAARANENLAIKLGRELNDHLLSLPRKERYSKELLRFWINNMIGSNSRTFNFFKDDADIIDSVQGEKGYADGVIDRIIQEEVAIPFMQEQTKGSGIDITGIIPTGPGFKADKSEADWLQLERRISQKFDKKYVKRSMLTARITWYANHHNQQSVTKYTLQKWEQFPFDISRHFADINEVSWQSFLYITDNRLLTECLKWVEKAMPFAGERFEFCDTYAQLLYKLGQKKRAVQWEHKAIELHSQDTIQQAALENMRKNKPTYLDDGANWVGYKHVNWDGVTFKRYIWVKDAMNKPIPGTTIQSELKTFKKSNAGTLCTVETSLGDTLTISAEGYISQKIKITKDPSQITVILEKAN